MRSILLASEAETKRLAQDLASLLMPSDAITFSGGLGAGKSFFVRAMLQYLAQDEALEVPSPTFTLVQSYPLERFQAHHADFYRLSDESEVEELGLHDDPKAVLLIEWPEKGQGALPKDRLDISLEVMGAEARQISFNVVGESWAERLPRLIGKGAFLAASGWQEARRIPMQGDCSTRIYTRLEKPDGSRAILMDAPIKPDPGLGAVSYSKIAHIAEDMLPFVAVGEALRARGFSAPEIFAHDLGTGFLLLEDLGTEGVLQSRRIIMERYEAAVDCLIGMHQKPWENILKTASAPAYELPPFDTEAMLAEVALYLDWYLPHMGIVVSQEAREEFSAIWRVLADDLQEMPKTIILRDYHSPNLIWLEGREGLARVGIIDYQDALYGPEAYDLVSMTQDARVFIPEAQEKALLSRYMEARMVEGAFHPLAFYKSYKVMGAQRATKVLGIFARLAKRDNKAHHLDKLPIVRDYLARNLTHYSLEDLAKWHEAHVPVLEPA